jgi:hypothetical protein
MKRLFFVLALIPAMAQAQTDNPFSFDKEAATCQRLADDAYRMAGGRYKESCGILKAWVKEQCQCAPSGAVQREMDRYLGSDRSRE